jgi:[ribosomal protein S5]-alanine N-acetyltransferase
MIKVISQDFSIETARCLLRCSSVDDIPAIFEATRVPEFHQGMESEAPETIEQLYEALTENSLAWAAGRLFSFTIADLASNNLLGRIGIHKNTRLGVWNLGFWTHPEHQSKGYMTEAVTAIIGFGFERLDAAQIEASYALWNKSSQRVMEKSGMKFVGYMPHAFQKRGRWIEANKMRITRQEWLAVVRVPVG